ncbi:MAG: ABC transporter ATP-binding protein [Streptomycetales bacterium]
MSFHGREPVLFARELAFGFGATPVLAGVDLSVRAGEVLAVMGRSGSGKSTLLHCLAGLLTPHAGEVWLAGRRIDNLPERRRCDLRLRAFGFVFQFGDLLPELDLVENVELPLRMLGAPKRAARRSALEVMERLGIASQAHRQIAHVSGGEQQRAALARALARRPQVVFADEPTGSLDDANRAVVLDLMVSLARADQVAVVVATHDRDVAARCDRVRHVEGGRLLDLAESR